MKYIIRKSFAKSILLIAIVLQLLGVSECDPKAEDLIVIPDKTYIKLDNAGNPLVNQSVAWNFNDTTASETNFDRWSCLLDEEKGLVWEIKTHNNTLRDYKWKYTWYSTNPLTNGGDHGIGDLGELAATYYETVPPDGAFMGSDRCLDVSRCDTEKFVADVNTVGLCGASDWRLPAKDELAALGYGKQSPYINTTYFADVKEDRDSGTGEYRTDDTWTSTIDSSDPTNAYAVFFGVNSTSSRSKSNQFTIRLIRNTSQ